MYNEPDDYRNAIEDFRRARSKADLIHILHAITGYPDDLLSYDEVRKMLKTQGAAERGLQEIPLDAITGSVGRYTDFNRDFLPKQDIIGERWARIRAAADSMQGLPPIEVYQIGQVYFVKDGNHRVSVARQIGQTHIQAYVTEVRTRVPLSPDTSPDDLIIKAEYAEFLETTQLDVLRPQADLTFTVPGQYPILLEHISVHRYYMGIDLNRPVTYPEAVEHWYDTIYLPIIQIIRQQDVLSYFPGRTEADLYLWLSEHRAALQDTLGWQINPETAATDLIDQQSPLPSSRIARLGGKLFRVITPSFLESGPPPGQWRKEQGMSFSADQLFNEILVAISGEADGWTALEQALAIAKLENARLFGLHVVGDQTQLDDPALKQIQQEFNQRCDRAGIPGQMSFDFGDISDQIHHRARWVDMIVVNVAHPPAKEALSRMVSGFRNLIQRTPRPVLSTPRVVSPLTRALLAYDGSPKAEEALYVAAYLAGKWHIPLVVATISDSRQAGDSILDNARQYLEKQNVAASYVQEKGSLSETLLQISNDYACDFILMGGYSLSPLLELVFGSLVDDVLRSSDKPLLICR